MRHRIDTVMVAKVLALFTVISIVATGCTSCRIFGGPRGEEGQVGEPKEVSVAPVGDDDGTAARRPPAREAAPEEALLTVHFDYDSATLTPQAIETLKKDLEWMKANPDVAVLISGHCDERGTIQYNIALGSRRANSVRDFLIKSGVGHARLHIISYGEERPVDPGYGEAHWWKNRRAEFGSYE